LEREQLKKIWNAQRLLGAPLGQIMRLLILTGCRLNEVALAQWSEIDLKAKVWTIPAKRMKMKKPHAIHLTDIMVDVLRSLKRGTAGDYVFSINDGKSPYRVQSRAKAYVNDVVGFSNWVNHDLRHTMRTNCSSLGVAPHVAEKMIAHTKKGYDHHDYKDEMRDGFSKWHGEVARIVGWSPKLKLVA
jgi:integrase